MKKIILVLVAICTSQFMLSQISPPTASPFDNLISTQGYDKTLTFDMNTSPSDVKQYRFISSTGGIAPSGGASVLKFQSQVHNSWTTSMTFNSNKVGIGTDYPQEIFDVNGTARAEKLVIDPPSGGRFLQMGEDVGSDLRIFNFSTSGNYAGASSYDVTGQKRYEYYHNIGVTSLGIRNENDLEIFKVAESSIGSYIHLPQAQSRIVISDFGSYRINEGHKLVIKNGDALVEGDIIAEDNIGIGTGDPLNKLQLGNSMSFHDGGNEVIGFGYAPGSNTDLNTNGYASEIRVDQDNGRLSLGIATSKTNNPTTRLTLHRNGNVGVGTANPDAKLAVNGRVHAEEVKVDLNVPADYVFQKYYDGASILKEDYRLLSLKEVENFTKKNHHLPEVPSAQEMMENGVDVGKMTNLLLQKIEELTLYTIEQEKRIQLLEGKMKNSKTE